MAEQQADVKAFMRDIERDDKGRFVSKTEQFERVKVKALALQQAADKATAALSRQGAQIESLSAKLAKQATAYQAVRARIAGYGESQKGLRDHISALNSRIRQQTELIRQQRHEAHRATREQQSYTGSLLRTGVALGLLYKSYSYIVDKVQDLTRAKLSGALIDPRILGMLRGRLPQGVTEARGLGLAGRVLGASPALRYGADRGQTLSALAALQGATRALGQTGDDLIAEFVKSLEPAMQRGFVEAVNVKGPQAAIAQYATGANIGVADQLLNALQIQGQADAGTLDPLLAATLKTQEVMTELNATIERLTNELAGSILPALTWFQKQSGGTQAALAGGALAAGLFGPRLALAGVRALPGLVGLGGAGAAGAGAAGTAGAAGAAGALAAPPAALIAAGVLTAVGVGATAYQGYKLWGDLDAMNKAQQEAAQGQQRVEAMAAQNQQSADDLTKLRGQRQALDARIAKYAAENTRAVFRQTFGADALSDYDKGIIASMQRERDDLQRKIAAAYPTGKGYPEAAAPPAPPTAEQQRLDLLRQQAAEREDAALQAARAAAETALARTGLTGVRVPTIDVGKLPPMPEIAELDAHLAREIETLERVLRTIDASTATGAKEAAEVRNQVRGLRTEQRTAALEAVRLRESDRQQILGNKQIELEIARLGPLGIIGTYREMQALRESLSADIEQIQKYMDSIDKGTEAGRREAERARGEILRLRLQDAQLSRELRESWLNAVRAEVIGGSAAFESIIVTETSNVALALKHQLFKWNEQLRYYLGAVGDNVSKEYRPPIRLSPNQWAELGAFPQPETAQEIIERMRPAARAGTARTSGSAPVGLPGILQTAAKWLQRAAESAAGMERATSEYHEPGQIPGNTPG